jgi:hypothetical protein
MKKDDPEKQDVASDIITASDQLRNQTARLLEDVNLMAMILDESRARSLRLLQKGKQVNRPIIGSPNSSDAENIFARYVDELQSLVVEEFHDLTMKLHSRGLRFRQSGQNFDQLGSKIPLQYTRVGQVRVNYIHFVSPITEEVETIEILIGHNNLWHSVLYVWSSFTEPAVIETTDDAFTDMVSIRERVIGCFHMAGLTF